MQVLKRFQRSMRWETVPMLCNERVFPLHPRRFWINEAFGLHSRSRACTCVSSARWLANNGTSAVSIIPNDLLQSDVPTHNHPGMSVKTPTWFACTAKSCTNADVGYASNAMRTNIDQVNCNAMKRCVPFNVESLLISFLPLMPNH